MKSLLIVLALMGTTALAQSEDRSAKSGPHSVSALVSFPRGGFSLGGGYEYMLQDSMGVEGHFRFFAKEDDPPNRSDGMVIIGAGASHHFYKKSWDLSFTPSFNVINIDSATPGGDDTTALGPGLSVSLLTQVSANVALGFDWGNYWVWFDDDYAGKRVDDLAFKLRLSF
jgi:hypothetical protein